MWFSPLKGAHLTLGQLDKTLPVDMQSAAKETNKNIERGSFVYIKAVEGTTKIAPRFALYGKIGTGESAVDVSTKPNAVPYIALMGVYDFQAGMAGNVGQAPETAGIEKLDPPAAGSDNLKFLGKKFTDGAQSFEGPRITAISIVQPAEYQTTAFETTNTDYYVGEPLTISENGKLTHFTTGHNIVGYVTAVPKTRWINNLGDDAAGARITGGNAKVIEFSTAWIPVAGTTPTPNTSGEGEQSNAAPGNVGQLSAGKPQVQAAAANAKAPAAPAK